MSRIPLGIWVGMVLTLLGVLTRDLFGVAVGAVIIVATLITTARRDRDQKP